MSLSDFDRVLDSMYGGSPSYTGKLVSQSTALQVSAVWACIQARADDFATLPLPTYQRVGEGVELATGHYLWSLLQYEANPLMTAWRFKHLMQSWVDLWGNAYAEIEMNGRGQVTALWPWRPDRVKILRMPDGGLMYGYTMQGATEPVWLSHEHVLHVRGLSIDGIVGLSPIEHHKQTLGLSMAVTEHGARFFGNGARPLGVIQYPGKLNDKALASLRESWLAEHQGLSQAHRVAILEEGVKYQDVGSTMVDAQYLEILKFSAEDIARLYKMPQHRIGLLSHSTKNNIEHQGREYVDYTQRPLSKNWTDELEFSLLSLRDRDTYCVVPDFSSLILGDMKTQAEFYGSMINNGIMTQNEARRKLHLNPLPFKLADTPWKQGAQVPAGDSYTPPSGEQIAHMIALERIKPKRAL